MTIKLLGQRHGATIKDLQISNFSEETRILSFPFYGLEKLHAADMDPQNGFAFLCRMMVENHSSLRHLKLGCEGLISSPPEREYRFTDDMLGDFERAIELFGPQRYSTLLQLQTLHLIGFDFRKLTADSEAPFLGLSGLSRINALTLESCFVEGATFSLLSPQTAIGSTWTPKLQSFSLRHEKTDATFQQQVMAFLGSFTGLVHLSVLLEGSGEYLNPDCFIKNHGKTLKTLVWDQRSKPRTSVRTSTTILNDDVDLPPYTELIAQGCPSLRELGLSLEPCGLSLTYQVSTYSCHLFLKGQYTYSCSGS